MRNQQLYIINGVPAIRIIQQPNYLDPRAPRYYHAPPPAQFLPAPPPPIHAIQGLEVVQEYEAEAGDPVVIEQAVFRGQVVQVGEREKQAIGGEQAILISQGYASEDGKSWKPVPRIMMTIFKLGQLAINTVTKVKAKFDSSLPQYKIMKVTSANCDYYLALKPSVFNQWFLRLIWAKLIIQRREVEDYGSWGPQIEGRIFKKSEFLGEWEPRYVRVGRMGLQSRKEEGNSASLQIKQTKQIWTRFEEIKGGMFIVVKLWYGIIKQQFAIPVKESVRWLSHILTLLRNS